MEVRTPGRHRSRRALGRLSRRAGRRRGRARRLAGTAVCRAGPALGADRGRTAHPRRGNRGSLASPGCSGGRGEPAEVSPPGTPSAGRPGRHRLEKGTRPSLSRPRNRQRHGRVRRSCGGRARSRRSGRVWPCRESLRGRASTGRSIRGMGDRGSGAASSDARGAPEDVPVTGQQPHPSTRPTSPPSGSS